MQPRRLTLRNFGPFINETIDFSDFEEGGLFLISGKTGAGKTTIFDSMTYALFGATTGQERSGKEMRSLFASPDEMTSVSFVFEHQNHFYEVERSPEQTLRKKRGEGTTSQTSKVSLTIYDASMKEQRQMSTRSEVDTFIKDLLQLDAKQFFQIILLPQGAFRNFLVASSGDKEKLLRNVFGTAMYQRLTDWLHEEQRKKGQEFEKQSQQIQTLGEQFTWTGEIKESLTIPEKFTHWEQDMILLEEELRQKETQHQELKTQVTIAEQEFYAGKALKEQKLAYEARQLVFEALEKQAPIIQEQKARLAFLQKLEKDQPLFEKIEQERLMHQEKQASLVLLFSESSVLQEQMKQWEKQTSFFEKEKQQLQEKIVERADYQRLLPIAEERANLQATKEALNEKMARQNEQLVKVETSLIQMTEERQTLKEALQGQEDLPQLEVRLFKIKEQVKQWEEKQKAFCAIEQLLQQKSEKITVAQEKWVENTEIAALKETVFKKLQNDYAKSQITYWRSKLLLGEPCLICGSLEHPVLLKEKDTNETQETVTEEAVQAAEATWQQAREGVLEAKSQVDQLLFEQDVLIKQQTMLQEEIDKLALQLVEALALQAGVSPTEGYAQAWEAFEQQRQAYDALAAKHQDLEAQHLEQAEVQASLLAEIREQENQKLQLDGQLASLEKQIAGLSLGELQTMNRQLTETIETLEAAIVLYEKTGQDLRNQDLVLKERTQEWTTQLAEMTTHLAAQEQELQSRIHHYSEDATEEQLRQRFLELAEITTLTTQVTDYEEQWKILQSRLAEEANLQTIPLPDLAQLEATYETLKNQEAIDHKALLQQKNDQERNQALMSQLQKQWQKNQSALEELGELQQLSATLRGDNPEKLSLERYILQSFLQEVLLVANQRLIKLTRGRYQFLLAEEKGSYRNSTGLEINIYDDNAGTSRRSQTLSGGESFIAALALALSLADVIQQQSGGISIEALFIDEGFGSLDEESLEMALEALAMIEQEGRLIGIISHVRELKDRIVQQLIVETNGAGQSQTKTKIG